MANTQTVKPDIKKIIEDFMDFQKFMEEQQKQDEKKDDRVKKRSGGPVSNIDVPFYSPSRDIDRIVANIRAGYKNGGTPTNKEQLRGQLEFLVGALQGRQDLGPREVDLLLELQAELNLLKKK
jgi:hypothetical protein